jgi:hypothetical protein
MRGDHHVAHRDVLELEDVLQHFAAARVERALVLRGFDHVFDLAFDHAAVALFGLCAGALGGSSREGCDRRGDGRP